MSLQPGPGVFVHAQVGGNNPVQTPQLIDSTALVGAAGGISPIISSVETTGSAGTPPFIHLLNPGGSGLVLVVRKVRMWGTSGQVLKARRTNAPISLNGGGAVLTDGLSIRLNQSDATAIAAEFRGSTVINAAAFTRAQSQYQFPVVDANVGDLGLAIESEDFPLYIVAGSALEMALDANSAVNIIRATLIWDEIAA